MRTLTLITLALAALPARADEAADLAAFAKSVKGEFTDTELFGLKTTALTLPATAADADLAALAKLAPKRLDRLCLMRCVKLTDAGFLALNGMPKLDAIALPPQLTDKAFEGIAGRLPGLTSVTINGERDHPSRMTSAGVKSLAALKSLRHVSIWHAPAVADGIWASLAAAPSLASFQAMHCPRLIGAGVKRLAACPKLIDLDFSSCPLTEAGAAEIGELTSLQDLSLSDCGVTDVSAAAYARLAGLRSLSLGSVPITDAALEPLAGLGKLRLVFLADVPITDAGLASLAKCKALRSLSLADTKATEAGLAVFRDARPGVKVRVQSQ